jgi:RpiB/LacA/LacB family sugar-phosphate isomerase
MNKPNLLVPMAGLGKRFFDEGFTSPKPLIMVDDKHIIDYAFDSINPEQYNITFVVRREHVNNFCIDKILKKKFGDAVNIVITESLTQGTVCSCLLAREYIANDQPLIIYTLDVNFRPRFNVDDIPKDLDGFVLTFKANSPAYSYVEIDSDGYATRTAEKEVISPNAAVGIYYFKTGNMFCSYARRMIDERMLTNNEYYVCPLYNILIEDGRKVGTKSVDKMHLMGTPQELKFFVKNSLPRFGDKRIAICADHSGFEAKELMREVLSDQGYGYIDFGTYTEKDCDYNDYIRQAAKHIKDGFCDFGIAFCRTGQGANIAANKIKGIRSALIFDEYTAEYAIRHNCANFFSIPSKDVSIDDLHKLVKIFASNSFDGGRHMSRVIKAEANENS